MPRSPHAQKTTKNHRDNLQNKGLDVIARVGFGAASILAGALLEMDVPLDDATLSMTGFVVGTVGNRNQRRKVGRLVKKRLSEGADLRTAQEIYDWLAFGDGGEKMPFKRPLFRR